MIELPECLVARWKKRNSVRLPYSVDMLCPYCGRSVNFRIGWSGKINEQLMHGRARCSGCSESPQFIMLDAQKIEGQRYSQGKVYVYPPPKVRQPIGRVREVPGFTDALERAYNSMIRVYNVGEWSGTAVLCRRMLEGVTKSLLPQKKQKLPLARQIGELPKHVDLEKPILTLANALKEGGNIGAHFDLEKETDEVTATLMADLLEYLIEYLFILPKRIEELEEKIEDLARST